MLQTGVVRLLKQHVLPSVGVWGENVLLLLAPETGSLKKTSST